jgi:hypothetical protein
MLRLYPTVGDAVGRSIFITGSIRTGTTMMGQLIHSLKDVEHENEPPLLYAMFPLIDEMPAKQWKYLFEVHLFHDFMLNALAGRRINHNRHDQSSVYHCKPEEEIAERMSRTHRAGETFPMAHEKRISFKMPEVLPYLPKLRSYYPSMPMICMFRRPESVIASILYYEWYADKNFEGFNGEWLFKEKASIKIPYWVPEDVVARWPEMKEVERAGFAFVHQYSNLGKIDNLILVDYDDFLAAPASKFAKLAKMLEVEYGPMTQKLLDNVKETDRDRRPPMEDINPALRREIDQAYETCKRLATAL